MKNKAEMSGLLICIAAACILSFPAAAFGQLTPLSVPLTSMGFKKILKKQGVVVYRQSKRSPVILAAEGTFSAPPEKVRKLLLDYSSHVGIVKHLTKSQVLEKGVNWVLVYERLCLPLISDRDYTLQVRWGNNGDILWMQFHVVPNRGPPPSKDYVRVLHHQGSWQLKPIDGGRATRARYLVSIDLAGALPAWLTGTGTKAEIPGMFVAFRQALADD